MVVPRPEKGEEHVELPHTAQFRYVNFTWNVISLKSYVRLALSHLWQSAKLIAIHGPVFTVGDLRGRYCRSHVTVRNCKYGTVGSTS